MGRVSSPLNVHLEHYEGPLDLLLDLIRKQQIDIKDIPIATITLKSGLVLVTRRTVRFLLTYAPCSAAKSAKDIRLNRIDRMCFCGTSWSKAAKRQSTWLFLQCCIFCLSSRPLRSRSILTSALMLRSWRPWPFDRRDSELTTF